MSRIHKVTTVIATLAIFALPMSANAVVSQSKLESAQTPPSVIAFNQKLKNGQIDITYAYLPNDGYLTIYQGEKNGTQADKVIGQTELKAGDHRNVPVKLNSVPAKGSALWVSLSNKRKESYWPKSLPLENELTME